MKEKKDCKIVQDLLPNYIENLTNDETNIFIEEHVKECDECKRILKNMQKDFELNSRKIDKREVKYIKKFNNKMKILKIVLLLIIVIFIVETGRKVIIISKLSSNAEDTIISTNYHRITYLYNKGEYIKSEIFSLGEKKKIIQTRVTEQGITTSTMFATRTNSQKENFDKYTINIYIESIDKKIVKLNQEISISVDPQNLLYTKNWLELLLYSIPASVKKTTFNGNECYYISNLKSLYSFSEGMYIDKNTGLQISNIAYEYKNPDGTRGRWPATEQVYEFNIVTEEDFIEPNIKEYEIQ